MTGDGQDGAGTIGKKHAAIGRANLDDVTCKVARRVIQALFGRRDVAARRVIIRAEMQAPAAALALLRAALGYHTIRWNR